MFLEQKAFGDDWLYVLEIIFPQGLILRDNLASLKPKIKGHLGQDEF